MGSLDCFKAYDIRGKVPEHLNEDIAHLIGRAFAQRFKPKKVAVGYDIRHTSPLLANALADGLMASGVDVFDIGLSGTEEIYHATAHFELDGGVMVTASHNPIEYNGMKLVKQGSQPISGDSGLGDIKALVEKNEFSDAAVKGKKIPLDARPSYIKHLLGYINTDQLKPLRIVSNPGNGGAGIVIDALREHLPFEFIDVHHEPDGTFPNGIPNPLLVERRQATIDAVIKHKADFGISWDGDFDRCFLFDANGRFIEGYYIVGLLAQAFLDKNAGAKIIHDPRLSWNTIEIVESNSGIPIQSKTGHAFIKERMRLEDAVYGGEMSAHHYFRDFFYCDSGMIPWLLIAELVSNTGQTLASMVDERMQAYPCSGEINFKVSDAKICVSAIREKYSSLGPIIDETDGVSMEFDNWRFNIRSSNTEPLLRLNVESKNDPVLMQAKTNEMSDIIKLYT